LSVCLPIITGCANCCAITVSISGLSDASGGSNGTGELGDKRGYSANNATPVGTPLVTPTRAKGPREYNRRIAVYQAVSQRRSIRVSCYIANLFQKARGEHPGAKATLIDRPIEHHFIHPLQLR